MATKVIMPKLSPTMEEGQISRWLKKEGDKVSMGEPLAEIDTDKATMEMQALANGVLRKIIINEGESAPLGQIIAIIGEPDEDISAMLGSAAAPAQPATKAPEKEPEQTKVDATQPAAPTGGQAAPSPPIQRAGVATVESVSTPGNGAQAGKQGERLIVSPLAARMAAESGVDLRSLSGSGPGGRIVKRDIEAAMQAQQSTATAAATGAVVKFPVRQAGITEASPYRDEPASEMRRIIAKRLVTSLGPIPHFFLTTEIEMDRAAEMRQNIKELDPDLKI